MKRAKTTAFYSFALTVLLLATVLSNTAQNTVYAQNTVTEQTLLTKDEFGLLRHEQIVTATPNEIGAWI